MINQLNVVIAELQLAVAKLANGEKPASVKALIAQAQEDLIAIAKSIGQGGGGDETPNA